MLNFSTLKQAYVCIGRNFDVKGNKFAITALKGNEKWNDSIEKVYILAIDHKLNIKVSLKWLGSFFFFLKYFLYQQKKKKTKKQTKIYGNNDMIDKRIINEKEE